MDVTQPVVMQDARAIPADSIAERPKEVSGPWILSAIDGIRGVAALMVLVYHVFVATEYPTLHWPLLRNLVGGFSLAVDFFFVISGFVLFLPVSRAGDLGDLRRYYVRRAARIFPAYLASLLALLVALPLWRALPPRLDLWSQSRAVWLLAHLTLTQHSIGAYFGMDNALNINAVSWTLNLELIFYLVLPLVAGWYFKRPFIGLAIALMVSLIWSQTAVKTIDGATQQFPSYAGHLALGMTGAWIFVRLRTEFRSDRLESVAPFFQLVSGAILLWMMIQLGAIRFVTEVPNLKVPIRPELVAAAFTVFLVATVLGPRWGSFVFSNRLSRWLGDISYGLYLWHLLFLHFAYEYLRRWLGDPISFKKMLIFVLLLSIWAGWTSRQVIELPAIRWARNWSPRAKTPKVDVPSQVQQ